MTKITAIETIRTRADARVHRGDQRARRRRPGKRERCDADGSEGDITLSSKRVTICATILCLG